MDIPQSKRQRHRGGKKSKRNDLNKFRSDNNPGEITHNNHHRQQDVWLPPKIEHKQPPRQKLEPMQRQQPQDRQPPKEQRPPQVEDLGGPQLEEPQVEPIEQRRAKPQELAHQQPRIDQQQEQQQPQSLDIFVDIDPKMTSAMPSTVVVAEETPDIPLETMNKETHININSSNIQDNATAARQSFENDDDNDVGLNEFIEDPLNMISNLTKLNTASGSEVYLVGTAHFSRKSVEDVQKLVQLVKPNAVILELCEERAFMLQLDEQLLLEHNRKLTFAKIRSAIEERGLIRGLIYIVLVKVYADLTEKLGMAPGVEFRAGSKEARKIPGCDILLGDRSLKVTIARAVDSLSLWQKFKLICHALVMDVSITEEDVEKCKDKDILEQMLKELGGEFPGFKRVLLDERNIYLAHSIYSESEIRVTSQGPARVVAIVGCGHVDGIVNHWGTTTDEDCLKIMEVPKTSKTRKAITKTIKYCSLALIVYFGYRTIVPSTVQTAIYDRITSSRSLSQ